MTALFALEYGRVLLLLVIALTAVWLVIEARWPCLVHGHEDIRVTRGSLVQMQCQMCRRLTAGWVLEPKVLEFRKVTPTHVGKRAPASSGPLEGPAYDRSQSTPA